MAMTTCPECGNWISTEAEICPRCGYPIAKKKEGTETIENYISLAKNAYDSKDMTEAIKYCDRALEINSNLPSIWLLKGNAEAWSSTFANIKISKMMNCYKNAYSCLTDKDNPTVIYEAYTEAKRFFLAVFNVCLKQINNGLNIQTAKTCLETYKNIDNAFKTFKTDFNIDINNDYKEIIELGFNAIVNSAVDNYYYVKNYSTYHSPSTPNFTNEDFISTTRITTFLFEELSKLINEKQKKLTLYNAIVDFNDGCASYNYGPVWGEIGAELKKVSQIYREKVKALENLF